MQGDENMRYRLWCTGNENRVRIIIGEMLMDHVGVKRIEER